MHSGKDQAETRYREIQRAAAIGIWHRNIARALESTSGMGSTMESTRAFRAFLSGFLERHAIKSLLDLPCGDFHWMREVDLSSVDYLGLDVVPECVERNRALYGRDNVDFAEFDALSDQELPSGFELIVSRDFWFHLSFGAINLLIGKIRRSGARYLITTTFDEVTTNPDLDDAAKARGWGYRPINVQIPPFELRGPGVDGVQETGEYCGGRWQRAYEIADL